MRVLIVRLGSMGDVLHALPAAAALRAADPGVHIGWAIERRWTPLLVADGCDLAGPRSPQRPLVDRVHIVDTLGWRRSPLSDATWSDIRHTFRDIRVERYDLAIDFQGSIKSALVAQLSGAPSRVGFAQPREKPATMFYTHTVQPTAAHIIDQNLSLISPLCPSVPPVVNGFPLRTFAFLAMNVLPVDSSAESEVDRKLNAFTGHDQRSAHRFLFLNPGAGWPAKQWPSARYGEVARALRDDGIVSLVNYGPGEEALAREVEAVGGRAARPVSCTLPELVVLTRRAALFIGGDTGPMHLAALLGVPTVALFGPTDPARNGPYSPTAIVLRHPASVTTTKHSSEPDPGLLQITAAEVIAAARKLLGGPGDQRLATSGQRPEPEP